MIAVPGRQDDDVCAVRGAEVGESSEPVPLRGLDIRTVLVEELGFPLGEALPADLAEHHLGNGQMEHRRTVEGIDRDPHSRPQGWRELIVSVHLRQLWHVVG